MGDAFSGPSFTDLEQAQAHFRDCLMAQTGLRQPAIGIVEIDTDTMTSRFMDDPSGIEDGIYLLRHNSDGDFSPVFISDNGTKYRHWMHAESTKMSIIPNTMTILHRLITEPGRKN